MNCLLRSIIEIYDERKQPKKKRKRKKNKKKKKMRGRGSRKMVVKCGKTRTTTPGVSYGKPHVVANEHAPSLWR